MPDYSRIQYPLFDWLRIILASLVFVQHAQVTGLVSPGNFAVQIFFALSGWLIGGILLKMPPAGLPRFFYDRATRIWIPYLPAVAAIYILTLLKDGGSPYFLEPLAFDLTFTHNWFISENQIVGAALPMQGTGSHFWSISVEEQFYLIAPLVLVLSPLRKSLTICAILALVMIGMQGWYGSVSAGVLAAMLQRRFGDWHLTRQGVLAISALFATAAAGYLVMALPYRLCVPLAAVAVVLLTARPGHRGTVTRLVGGLSFPLYLYHWMGLFVGSALVKKAEFAQRPAMLIGYVAALAIAAAAYAIVDRRVLRARTDRYRPAYGKAAIVTAGLLLVTGILLGTLVIGPLDSAPPSS
ncbi:acyltransferase family protein [Paracoccus sp. (in: a-proteobacteria)]|uniref:acyltransferase family protein n=1 Tax=Paracoccus sp. TaxID=267 RepID=UPI003A8A5C76